MAPRVQANTDDLDHEVAAAIDWSMVNQFRKKFPRQTEHTLRLIHERLNAGLRKDSAQPLTTQEIANLAEAFYAVYTVWSDIKE